MPDFKNPPSATCEEMISDIETVFRLFDHIEWLQFVGGEIFLHDGIATILDYCRKYEGQFTKLILETNATILPKGDVIKILQKYKERCSVMISDYGDLSRKRYEFRKILEQSGIPYTSKKYYGDNQHFGGWVDNTGLCDLGESENVIETKAAGCAQVRIENMHCFKGKLHRCSNSLFLYELGLFEPNEDDFVELHNVTKSDSEKREIIGKFYIRSRKSCRYCAWKDSGTLARYPAAEQLQFSAHELRKRAN
jgi:hypothetical protein